MMRTMVADEDGIKVVSGLCHTEQGRMAFEFHT